MNFPVFLLGLGSGLKENISDGFGKWMEEMQRMGALMDGILGWGNRETEYI